MFTTNRCLRIIFFGLVLYSSLVIVIFNQYSMSTKILSVNYKVFGKVQGVFFRKFTKGKADQLGLVGWVMNERDGTVVGVIQGIEDKIQIMKKWLSTEGSPYGKVDHCDFTNEKVINKPEFQSFEILR